VAAIVVSGGYEDDRDLGWNCLYLLDTEEMMQLPKTNCKSILGSHGNKGWK
jgi:hypothetical protein